MLLLIGKRFMPNPKPAPANFFLKYKITFSLTSIIFLNAFTNWNKTTSKTCSKVSTVLFYRALQIKLGKNNPKKKEKLGSQIWALTLRTPT